jgi:hypothetical protein
VKIASCSIYEVGSAEMVTFSNPVYPTPANGGGHGVPPYACDDAARDLTKHNVGGRLVGRNAWSTTPEIARPVTPGTPARQLVCLLHVAWFGSVLTITVRDGSGIMLLGDACHSTRRTTERL